MTRHNGLRCGWQYLSLSTGTLLPAEPRLAKNPELVIVKVDFSPRWQEGVGQLAIQPIKTWVEWRPPTVCVVEGVET